MSEKVSIIIPTYNRENTIKRAIDSILNQTYKNYEIIVVDDCSEDKTESIVKDLNNKRIIYIKNEKNIGGAASRNVGLNNASGEIIAFLDSDNEWKENYLEDRLHYIDKGYNFVFGRIEIIEENGNKVVLPTESFEEFKTYEDLVGILLDHNIIDTNSVVMKKKLFDQYGGFTSDLKKYQDWDYFMSIIFQNDVKYYFCDNVLVNNYRQKDSISYNSNTTWESLFSIFVNHIDEYRKYDKVGEMLKKMFISDYAGVTLLDRVKQIEKYIKVDDYKNIIRFFASDMNMSSKEYRLLYDEKCLLLEENKKKEKYIEQLQIDRARKNLLEEENKKKEDYILELQREIELKSSNKKKDNYILELYRKIKSSKKSKK